MAARGMHPATMATLANCLGDAFVELRRHWMTLNHVRHVLCLFVYAALFHTFCTLFGVYAKMNSAQLLDDLVKDRDLIVKDEASNVKVEGLDIGGVDQIGSSSAFSANSPVEKYGWVLTILLYSTRVVPALMILPFLTLCCLGLVLFSIFPTKPRMHTSPLLCPFICFRVVTRGTFPKLVKHNVETNLKICSKLDLQNFLFEVVTDHPINLPKMNRVHEVVVPKEYRTKTGTLYKARALQYGLEVDKLSKNDWIAHLDEETLLTEDAVVGILNFVSEGRRQFGQGVISYGQGHVVNWATTLADNLRVAVDYGSIRFCLKVFRRPFYGWKGSFIVANAGAEKDVTFDHGPEASIAEDCFFAATAFQRGYSFGWVQGEMHEKSTFTVHDFVQQRTRWMRGIAMAAKSSRIQLRYKVGPVLMTLLTISAPLPVIHTILGVWVPLPLPWHFDMACAFITTTFFYMGLVGFLTSFSIRRLGLVRYTVIAILSAPVSLLVSLVLELTAAILAFWLPISRKTQFYIVAKESTASSALPLKLSSSSSSAPPSVLLPLPSSSASSSSTAAVVHNVYSYSKENGCANDHNGHNGHAQLPNGHGLDQNGLTNGYIRSGHLHVV